MCTTFKIDMIKVVLVFFRFPIFFININSQGRKSVCEKKYIPTTANSALALSIWSNLILLVSLLNSSIYFFQIYVNGHLHQKVRSASRTKALLHGLNLKKVDFELSIHSIGCHGTTVSTSDVVNYVKEMVLKPPPVPMSTKK